MGIPAFPRAVKSLPMSESIASLFRSFSSHNSPSGSRRGVPQWQLYKPKPRKLRGLWEITELETEDAYSLRGREHAENESHVHPEPVAKREVHPNKLQTV